MKGDSRPIILVADDVRENLVYLIGILGTADYDVVVAENGKRARDLVEREGVHPDLFLLDIMMPEMDGLTLCRHLRTKPSFAETPVIFVTAKEASEDVVAGFEAGAQDYVTRPFNPRELLARIRTQLKLFHALRDNKRLRQRLELHIRNTPLGVIEWHPDCRIAQWNPAAERIFGYRAAEVVGRFGNEILAPPGRETHPSNICNRLVEGDGEHHRVQENRNKDGDLLFCEWYNTPLANEHGEVIGIASLVADVTERLKAERALREARDKAEWLARIDPLTEMNNRRSFFDLAESELKLSHRHHHPLSVVMIDIDHFKMINDVNGHAAGDEALRKLAALIRETLRQSDVSGRMGGEEFALLLPETDLIGAQAMVERLRERIENSPIHTTAGDLTLTISAGITELRNRDHDISAPLSRADGILLRAKRSGRNRVLVDEDEP